MSYEETLNYLYASTPAFHLVGAAAYKPGLDNTYLLMEQLGNPYRCFPSIHIAGTNGKGSTSHLIAAALQQTGRKVGLYTSPHLVDFRERIRINGSMIDRAYVVNFVQQHWALLEQVRPSFFEITMTMAFCYFAEQKVDVAVVEVGLGGRLDSTNILTPLLSVITNVGMDHMEFLGNTLPQIAYEKAGIIKPNVPCVIGEGDAQTLPVFLEQARKCGIMGDGLETSSCRCWIADQCVYLSRLRERVIGECQLHGIYQTKNMQTAFVALMALQQSQIFHFTNVQLASAFASVCTLTGLRGRWEIVGTAPLTICDTGHNSHALKYVSAQLQQLWATTQTQTTELVTLHIVFGMVNDKDVEVVLPMMPTNAKYYFATPPTQRAIAAEKLQSMWQNLHPDAYSLAFASVSEAIRTAHSSTRPTDIVFIGGSNYVVGEALRYYSNQQKSNNVSGLT